MISQNKLEELSYSILSASSPAQISSACALIEDFLQKHTSDQTRSFFSLVFPSLICKIFGFDDSDATKSPGWIEKIQMANDSQLADNVFDLLSPSGILMNLMLSTDRHSMVKYVFPMERLPEWVRIVLQSDQDCRILSDLCPLFKDRIVKDTFQGFYQIRLNVLEYYIFWFAYYPVCKANNEKSNLNSVVLKKNPRFRFENWTSLPVLSGATRGFGKKKECTLYLRLLYAYLQTFVSNCSSGTYQPYRSSLLNYSSDYDDTVLRQAEFLVNTLTHFWLVDNDFSPISVSICRSFGIALPFRAILGQSPPSTSVGEIVKFLIVFLNSSLVVPKEENGPGGYGGTSKWNSVSRIGLVQFSSLNSFGSWNSFIQRSLYRYILRTFLFCPMGTSITNSIQVFSVWLTYIEPWKISVDDFSDFNSAKNQSSIELRKGSSECDYVPSWQGYILSNYLYYNSLVVHFLGFAHKFLHNNVEAIIQMVLKVLKVLTSSKELMNLLRKVDEAYHSKPARLGTSSPIFASAYNCIPSIREQLQDWEDGLCENEADGSFLHENWNQDLKLFSEGEDGGHQLLQLLILRAEVEVHSISGEKIDQNLEILNSLKKHMAILFGGSSLKLTQFPSLETLDDHHHREDIFTPKKPGIGKRTWADVQFKGDWMRRPISDGEVAWLAKFLIKLSDRLNVAFGLDNDQDSFIETQAHQPLDQISEPNKYTTLLYIVLHRLVLTGRILMRFVREHGLRINLRVLASKKVVMILLVFILFSFLKNMAFGILHTLAFLPS